MEICVFFPTFWLNYSRLFFWLLMEYLLRAVCRGNLNKLPFIYELKEQHCNLSFTGFTANVSEEVIRGSLKVKAINMKYTR